jgi:hypothetical protein
MKQTVIIFAVTFVFGCNNFVKQNQVLTDQEWKDVFGYTLSNVGNGEVFIFNKFDNTQFKDLLLKVYEASSDLGYNINDTIQKYINERENKLISAEIGEKISDKKVISDTTNVSSSLVVYSEPFFVNSQILIVAISIKKNSLSKDLVFFFKKTEKQLKIIKLYDSQKDMYYKVAPH